MLDQSLDSKELCIHKKLTNVLRTCYYSFPSALKSRVSVFFCFCLFFFCCFYLYPGTKPVEGPKPEVPPGVVVGAVTGVTPVPLLTPVPVTLVLGTEIGRAVQQECRDRSRMPSSA
eukprot:TRINITY_DN8953_c0_g1_i4.p1 TRINITY_DN8953_c0_g1~~TRINITY_DN8953_c0_g1_i4.p1  ORF type:complete len:116 (-),score=9.88 TRINITY_DN8953_c0_g1_i4:10-357(-)